MMVDVSLVAWGFFWFFAVIGFIVVLFGIGELIQWANETRTAYAEIKRREADQVRRTLR